MTKYIWLIIAAFVSGCLCALREYDKMQNDPNNKSKTTTIIKLIYCALSSMLMAWIVFEFITFNFTDYPASLAAAIASFIGYMGAETTYKLVMDFINKKMKD